MAAQETEIFEQVHTLADLRRINRQIREEMRRIQTRDELLELKRKSDYLCNLTQEPYWRQKFGKRTRRFLQVAREEDARTTRFANRVSKRHNLGSQFRSWQEDI